LSSRLRFAALQAQSESHRRERCERVHRAKIIGSGISDTDTLDYLARLLGDEEITQLSATAGEHGRRSTTESTSFRTLAPAHLVREGRPGGAVLVYGNLPPARLQLRPLYSDRRLTRLVETQP
jgi:type IV secretion system protein VirD4